MARLVTVELCRANDACYFDERLRTLLGEGKPLADVLRMSEVPARDRVWAATVLGALDGATLRLFVVDCALRAMEGEHAVWREPGMEILAAVNVADRHARGQATDAELRAAAWDCAESAEMVAARAATEEARSARKATAAEWKQQVQCMLRLTGES